MLITVSESVDVLGLCDLDFLFRSFSFQSALSFCFAFHSVAK